MDGQNGSRQVMQLLHGWHLGPSPSQRAAGRDFSLAGHRGSQTINQLHAQTDSLPPQSRHRQKTPLMEAGVGKVPVSEFAIEITRLMAAGWRENGSPSNQDRLFVNLPMPLDRCRSPPRGRDPNSFPSLSEPLALQASAPPTRSHQREGQIWVCRTQRSSSWLPAEPQHPCSRPAPHHSAASLCSWHCSDLLCCSMPRVLQCLGV